MKQKDIDAIHHGIAKYDRLAHGFPEEIRGTDCQLCTMYEDDDCVGCPIFNMTGRVDCGGTPWHDIYDNKNFSFLWCHAVEGEIEFLILLLPEEEREKYNLEGV